MLHNAEIVISQSLYRTSIDRGGEIFQLELGVFVLAGELEGRVSDVFWPDGVVIAIRIVAEVGERGVLIRGVPYPNSSNLSSARNYGKRNDR